MYGFVVVSPIQGRVKDRIVGSAPIFLWLHCVFTLAKTIMETGNTHTEPPTDPYWKFYRDIQDAKRGLLSFDQLRAAWVAWAKQAIAELESEAAEMEKLQNPQPTDTTV